MFEFPKLKVPSGIAFHFPFLLTSAVVDRFELLPNPTKRLSICLPFAKKSGRGSGVRTKKKLLR
jgi:hypothetical protein